MPNLTISQITEKLDKLPPEKLELINDFISYLLERKILKVAEPQYSEAYQTMIASEDVLRRDWDRPEEDTAWANL